MSGILNDAAIAEMLGGSEEEGDDSDEIDLDNFTEEYPEYLSSSSSDEGEDSDEDNVPLSMLAGWQKKPFNGKPLPEEALHDPGDIKTPYEYFERYFTVELMEQMALTTNQYYMAKTGIQIKPVCSLLDIKKFFGIHAIVGCIKFPRLKMIWSEKYRYDPIANAMSRERFFLLRTNLHCVDVTAVNQTEEQTKNRLWRVQPVIDAVRNRCLQLPRDAGNYSVDEQMIPLKVGTI
ncbi:PiggyBac transposable element-derived protein 3 [Eumeta japonica]|uniref:PiggyBac transposable element-derived protein 3 n=1 Tax=Eumeta variegata TaxID=151549 RepID=A0A4C1YZP7_EUMVA|nr:PiggyBac transposable element-derived protein 3 [Eumeta japonica]